MSPAEAAKRLRTQGPAVVRLLTAAVAIALLVLPDLRTPAAHGLLGALYAVHLAVSFWRMWRQGLLSRTPAQIHALIRSGRYQRTPLLELPATLLGGIALHVVSWP